MTRNHPSLILLGALLLSSAASVPAQFEIKSGSFNSLREDPVDTTGTVTPQFSGRADTSATSGPIKDASTFRNRFPKGVQKDGGTVVGGIVLTRSSVGTTVASGVPRYAFGDEIVPPLLAAGNSQDEVDASYWRARPVAYGETFAQPEDDAETPLPDPSGTGDPPPYSYYYSPHAERVFAHQAGRVTITWVTSVPVYANGTTDDDSDGSNLKFRFRSEVFSVASGTSSPVRRIYWTQKTFDGPPVKIPSGRIKTVNIAYNRLFPQTVSEEFQPVGSLDAPSGDEELGTLWFEKTEGLGHIYAYNREGRVLIEYLGDLKEDEVDVHEFLGADVVEVVQVARPTEVTTFLGEQLLPQNSAGNVPDDADFLTAAAPVSQDITSRDYYGVSTRPDGSLVYHAEKENLNPDRVSFYWLEETDAGIHPHLPEPETPNLAIRWPKYLNNYLQVWPAAISEYAGITVEDTGATVATGIRFPDESVPEIIHQDDVAQVETSLDLSTQRLLVDLSQSEDKTNRTLLRFRSGNEVWYQRLFIQAQSVLGSPEVVDTDGDGPIQGTPAVYTLADRDADGVLDLNPSDVAQVVHVGQRIERPDPKYELAGFIAAGDHYDVSAYRDPFLEGVETAGQGAIIPVNAAPGADEFDIWWFERIDPPSPSFKAFYVPSRPARYRAIYPNGDDQIVLASNAGSGDLSPAQAAGSIYVQNIASQPGHNPNEEHALMLGGRAYAMRDDLNVTSGPGFTSQPFVLLSFIDPADSRPAMRVFKVVREVDQNGDRIADPGDILFDYEVTAGATIPAPMPLPLLPLPITGDGSVANREVAGVEDLPVNTAAPDFYDRFTFEDRKGFTKVYRGPHTGGSPTLGMQFYYLMREDFFVPGVATQPTVDSILPYLRPIDTGTGEPDGDPISGTPLTITYRPIWPETVPELRIGETLTLPKFGLPQVRGQSSAEVLYQQSRASATAGDSVVLHDPTRAKSVTLASVGLERLPNRIPTTIYNGRTYFQRLPPHLQQRFYAEGINDIRLVLEGEFVDEIAGEDYLNLNVLSAGDVAALKGLASEVVDANRIPWEQAIDDLVTEVETFTEDPLRLGTYMADEAATAEVDGISLAAITDSDTAVDSYALTATGTGEGYVSLLFGDGEAFTPEGDPVSIAIIKVTPKLYTGDMKVQLSSNPLDEQVGLRHSGDFAGKPENFEFEWRYAQPVDGQSPPAYTYGAPSEVIGSTTQWQLARNPADDLPSDAEYGISPSVTLPRSVMIYDPEGVTNHPPRLVLDASGGADFSGGIPDEVIFSADLSSDLDGFVLMVNRTPAIAFRAPEPFTNSAASSGISNSGLPLQFRVSPNYFVAGANRIEVALYSSADPETFSVVDFRLETVARLDRVDPAVHPASPWLKPNGTLLNQITVGGSPTAPLGDPLLLLQDNYFTVRYRPKIDTGNILAPGGDQDAVAWSDWMEPQLVPGWIKRVLDGINPYNQRMTDLFNNAVSTDVSVLTQAGTRWEGDIALNLDNVNEAGLIPIYETVLNRGRLFSIDNGYDNPGANDALLLAAGYLNDLYNLLGNEAYADAANPTIALDDQQTFTEVSSSRFSFESQVPTLLDEELALLRGRDDFLATSVTTAPAYNRLYWNYTNGIDSGEVLYAVNYNIKEKAGSTTANGIIDAADAQRMFPQAHGDAYGHYLTALKGYYKLLTHPNFTWTPRSEAVLVLGQNVAVDYFDERKFAASAANLARTAEQVLELTYRQAYDDDPASGWSGYRDNLLNSNTNIRRQFGVDEWGSRATQGTYYNWVVGNAMLPDEDTDPLHTGIQKVDRTTVPELAELAAAGGALQGQLDRASGHLNPLGLAPDAVAFDISPAALQAGESHYEQVYERAITAALNAKGSFDQAGRMTRLLRNQETQVDDYNTAIEEQERAFAYELVDLYGTPYPGDIGPGKTYAQGYEGPDITHWFVVDAASELADLSEPVTVEILKPIQIPDYVGVADRDNNEAWEDFIDGDAFVGPTIRTPVTVVPDRFVQYSEQFFGDASSPGQRRVTGELQTALAQMQEARVLLLDELGQLELLRDEYTAAHTLFVEMVAGHLAAIDAEQETSDQIIAKDRQKKRLENSALILDTLADSTIELAESAQDYLPDSIDDATSTASGALSTVGAIAFEIIKITAASLEAGAAQIETDNLEREIELDRQLTLLGYDDEQRQFLHEFELLRVEVREQLTPIHLRAVALQHASEKVANLLAKGDRIQLERTIFRQRAAAIIQGYRTRDVAFRTFRNEALEQYRTLFDLAARYTFLAAKSYDYETGLLGSADGREVMNRIVSSRALGDLSNGTPQASASTLGDAGLAGTMAQLNADFSVARGRLGINNPDQNGTLFSLRQELFRITDDPGDTSDDTAWQQILEQHIVSDLMADPDAANFCNNLRKPDGSRVPGIIIPFSSTIQHGKNWFGLPLAGGDHNFTASNFSTKIYSAGMVLDGYVGMDPYAIGTPSAGGPDSGDSDSLAATPYVYLIPTGIDYMRAPALGDTGVVRAWNVADQALPLPYNLGGSDFNGTQFLDADGTLSEEPWIARKHQAFRPVSDPAFFFSLIPQEFTSERLVGRSAWNSGWKIVIPAYTLLNDEEEGLDRFVRSVDDIKIFLRTYSNSGN